MTKCCGRQKENQCTRHNILGLVLTKDTLTQALCDEQHMFTQEVYLNTSLPFHFGAE